MSVEDHRIRLWRLIEARHPDEIAELERLTGTTQRRAVDYAIERSGFRDYFPRRFAGYKGTPAARLVQARKFSRAALVYLVAPSSLMPDDIGI
jgi:hypothetical protein